MTTDLIAAGWPDYELLDFGYERRLERFGAFMLDRPDPEAVGSPRLSDAEWQKADAVFRENWQVRTKIPENWQIKWGALTANLKLAPFKHTGIFPEQSVHWEFMQGALQAAQKKSAGPKAAPQAPAQPKVLNLFAYTGMATLACAAAGAQVTHVDSSKKAITWARENQAASNLSGAPIRWILEDALKFAEREAKRGKIYDGIIMDPPAYGHGPSGEVWSFEKSFPKLVAACQKILAPEPAFVLINAYAIHKPASYLKEALEEMIKPRRAQIESGELFLQAKDGRRLSTGIYARFG